MSATELTTNSTSETLYVHVMTQHEIMVDVSNRHADEAMRLGIEGNEEAACYAALAAEHVAQFADFMRKLNLVAENGSAFAVGDYCFLKSINAF